MECDGKGYMAVGQVCHCQWHALCYTLQRIVNAKVFAFPAGALRGLYGRIWSSSPEHHAAFRAAAGSLSVGGTVKRSAKSVPRFDAHFSRLGVSEDLRIYLGELRMRSPRNRCHRPWRLPTIPF